MGERGNLRPGGGGEPRGDAAAKRYITLGSEAARSCFLPTPPGHTQPGLLQGARGHPLTLCSPRSFLPSRRGTRLPVPQTGLANGQRRRPRIGIHKDPSSSRDGGVWWGGGRRRSRSSAASHASVRVHAPAPHGEFAPAAGRAAAWRDGPAQPAFPGPGPSPLAALPLKLPGHGRLPFRVGRAAGSPLSPHSQWPFVVTQLAAGFAGASAPRPWPASPQRAHRPPGRTALSGLWEPRPLPRCRAAGEARGSHRLVPSPAAVSLGTYPLWALPPTPGEWGMGVTSGAAAGPMLAPDPLLFPPAPRRQGRCPRQHSGPGTQRAASLAASAPPPSASAGCPSAHDPPRAPAVPESDAHPAPHPLWAPGPRRRRSPGIQRVPGRGPLSGRQGRPPTGSECRPRPGLTLYTRDSSASPCGSWGSWVACLMEETAHSPEAGAPGPHRGGRALLASTALGCPTERAADRPISHPTLPLGQPGSRRAAQPPAAQRHSHAVAAGVLGHRAFHTPAIPTTVL